MIKNLISISAAALVCASAANAQVLFDGVVNDYRTGNNARSGTQTGSVDLGLGAAGADDTLEVLAFSGTAGSLGFSATGDPAATFGGFSIGIDGTEAFGGAVGLIHRDADATFPYEYLRSQGTTSGGASGSFVNSVTMWEVAPTDTLDQLTFGLSAAIPNAESASAHLVVRSGGTYYVAETAAYSLATAVTPGDLETLLFAAGSSNWQEWDFTANSGDNFNVAFTATAAPVASTIDAAGIYFTGSNASGVTQLDLATFSVVPEPSAYAALAGLAALGLVMSRRRLRR